MHPTTTRSSDCATYKPLPPQEGPPDPFTRTFYKQPVAVVAPPETAPLATTSEKFKITNLSYFWSGKRISIPESVTNSKDGTDFSKNLTPDNAESLFKTLTQVEGKGRFVLKNTGFCTQKLGFQYRSFWLSPSAKQDDQTADFLARLIQTKHNDTNAPEALMQYLQTPSQDEIEEQVANLKNKFLTASKKEAFTLPSVQAIALNYAIALDSQVSEIPTNHWTSFFKLKHITLTEQIGQGRFGAVYAAKYDFANSSTDYVFKKEKNPCCLNKLAELDGKWWRHGDIAASRIQDLPNFAKSLAFILEFTTYDNQTKQWYVPTAQIKKIGSLLPKETQVRILGQLMEKAPGTDLQQLLHDGQLNPSIHFNNIANSLFQFLERTFERNFIHRDLKPANFMYDTAAGQGTVVDAGIGIVCGKRNKMPYGELDDTRGLVTQKSKNRFSSNKYAGTVTYMAPAVLLNHHDSLAQKSISSIPYGSEVDFYSAAVILINLLDHMRFQDCKKLFPKQSPASTDHFITIFGNKSKLARMLTENPDMKQTIDLFLNVACANNEEVRDQAFQRLKTHMNDIVQPAISEQQQSQQQHP